MIQRRHQFPLRPPSLCKGAALDKEWLLKKQSIMCARPRVQTRQLPSEAHMLPALQIQLAEELKSYFPAQLKVTKARLGLLMADPVARLCCLHRASRKPEQLPLGAFLQTTDI